MASKKKAEEPKKKTARKKTDPAASPAASPPALPPSPAPKVIAPSACVSVTDATVVTPSKPEEDIRLYPCAACRKDVRLYEVMTPTGNGYCSRECYNRATK